jgi:hypothetical protein
VVLLGLGLPPEELPPPTLRTSEDQLRVLEAVVAALAKGRTSGLVASSIIAAVKAASAITLADQSAQIAELERRVSELADSRTLTVRR